MQKQLLCLNLHKLTIDEWYKNTHPVLMGGYKKLRRFPLKAPDFSRGDESGRHQGMLYGIIAGNDK